MVHDPERARAVAAEAIRSAAEVKNNPPDLINVALEMLVKESLELPAFSTLDAMAGRIRREVNTAMFERVASRIGLPDRVGRPAGPPPRKRSQTRCASSSPTRPPRSTPATPRTLIS